MRRARRTGGVPSRLAGLGLAAAALVVLTACGSANSIRAGTVIRVTERDFKISAPRSVPAGNVELLSRNRGPDDHELIVVHEHGGPLPLRPDGFTVDEDALESAKAGTLEPIARGTVGELQLHLRPGRYILFCNMAGHYLGGMHTTLVVR